ncbi:hypothetical protein DFJ74DRAFT_763938 [Hyaloraphidium curvatum]|nr:hypothetical protein DFJ74DRAFT_763938 [Hyaloraphidium curvatum]
MEQALSIAQGPPATPERPPPRDRDLGTKSNTLSAEATIAPHRNTVSDAFKDVESRLSKIPWMNTLETRTGMAKSLIATILSSLLLFTLFTGIAIRPLTVAFALAYPTYRVIDLAQRHQLEREWPQWLTYFAIVALINAADSFARPLLLFVLPSFDLIRLVVIGWMGALPGNNGAATLFNNIQER